MTEVCSLFPEEEPWVGSNQLQQMVPHASLPVGHSSTLGSNSLGPGPLGFGQSKLNLAERQHCALLGWPESLFIPHLVKGPLGIKHKHPQYPQLLQTQTTSEPLTYRDDLPRLHPPHQTFIKRGFPSSTSLTSMHREDQWTNA